MAKTATGARRALCVGINDYPYKDNDLKGCVNDARAWASLLTDHFDFPAKNVTVLIDKQATKRGTLSALKSLFTRAKAGDVLVFTNSSHGSYVVDKDGDEERYDEVLCPYDIDDNDIVDDELRALIEDLPKGVRLSVVLDNCFSGTATRARMNTPDDRRIRFLSPVLRGLPVLDTRGRPNGSGLGHRSPACARSCSPAAPTASIRTTRISTGSTTAPSPTMHSR
jgi:hypothetical protein